MKIAFLLDNAYGIGGTIRSVVNLSGALAGRHTVEVVSLRRHVARPALPFDPRVTLTPLIDLRPDSPAYDGDDPLLHRPSERFAEGGDHFRRSIATRLGDVRVRGWLRATDADVVIATRPKLNDYLAAYGDDRYLRIGQEHLTHAMHSAHTRSHQDTAVAGLDAFVTVSYADAADYRAAVPGSSDRPAARGVTVVCVPNAVPAPGVEPSDGESRLIVAAGRLIKVKRYDRLLRAFALVAEKHPDWTLRLYGRGKREGALRELIDRLGLSDRAFLMGAHSPLDPEWAKGAVAAVSSDAESFGMTLVEAMHCGVPVVSTDCPYGPGEIITNGRDGLLTPLAGQESTTVRAYADALLQLIENPEQRRAMGAAALEKAQRYAPERIAAEYEQLIEGLSAARSIRRRNAAEHPPPASPLPARAAPPPLRARLRRALAPYARPILRVLRGKRPSDGRPLPAQHARVRSCADGSLTVLLDAAGLPRGELSLLLRARNRPEAEPVRIPVDRSRTRDGMTEVRVERGAHRLLPEARWDTYVERAADGRRRRVRAELVETARLLTSPAPYDPEDGALAPWVPYTTVDGFLAVRAWHRPSHAEVTGIALERRGYRVRARLYGEAGAGEEPLVVGVPRGEKGHGFELPVRILAGPDSGSGPVIECEIPYELPAALDSGGGKATWDLWLRPSPEAPAIRLSRLLDDQHDRRATDVTPQVPLGDTGLGVRLAFSAANDLALRLTGVGSRSVGAERVGTPEPQAARPPQPRT
ncbi:glycosyltransferase [Streptomyces sp. ODS28]|uniref:glycosyltransferase n=1 Tax=Streptomyces sp. ODS28 TaxID=3136688 RepID=UPI0031E94F91